MVESKVTGEFLGRVQLSVGDFLVHMPTVKDMACIDTSKLDAPYRLAAISIGVSYEEFEQWSIVESSKVLKLLNKAMERL